MNEGYVLYGTCDVMHPNQGGFKVTLWRCKRCGGCVLSQLDHDKWHEPTDSAETDDKGGQHEAVRDVSVKTFIEFLPCERTSILRERHVPLLERDFRVCLTRLPAVVVPHVVPRLQDSQFLSLWCANQNHKQCGWPFVSCECKCHRPRVITGSNETDGNIENRGARRTNKAYYDRQAADRAEHGD